MSHHRGSPAVSLVCAVVFGFLSAVPASALPDAERSFTLQIAQLSLSPDFLPAAEDPGMAEAEGVYLSQAGPGPGASAAAPQAQSIFGRAPLRQGSWEIGALGAYSISGAGGPKSRPVVRAFWILPRVGYTFWEIPWYPASLQIYLEPAAAFITTPAKTYLVGVNAIFRHTFLIWRRFSPYIEGGAGFLNTNLRHRALGESIEFMPQGGAGFHIHVTEHASINAGYRFHHISNAGLAARNLGINSHFPYVGFTVFF